MDKIRVYVQHTQEMYIYFDLSIGIIGVRSSLINHNIRISPFYTKTR